MPEINRFAVPNSTVADIAAPAAHDRARLNRVASGQRLVVYSLLAMMLAGALQVFVGPIASVVALIASIASIVGVVRTTSALQRSIVAKILYVIAMFIPLINLLAMLALSLQATKALRAGGYKVGLLGAGAQ